MPPVSAPSKNATPKPVVAKGPTKEELEAELARAEQELAEAQGSVGSEPVDTSTPVVDETEEQPEQEPQRPVVYPDLEMVPYFNGAVKIGDAVVEGVGPMSEEDAKKLLGWETKAEFVKRTLEAKPGSKEEECEQGFLKHCLYDGAGPFKDFEKNEVICWNNTLNRPFVRRDSERYCQDILQGNWAGPVHMPGETVNCESVVIGRCGEVISGQKRLIGFILACQRWRIQEHWHKKPYWPDHQPVFESVVWLGCSEHPRVVQTIDNVAPRKESDVMYTTNQFPEVTHPRDRAEISKYVAHAVDVMWDRTGITAVDQWSKHRTHSNSLEFLGRHERLKDCVRLLFKLNRDRSVYNVFPNTKAGDLAGLMYLMAASATDRERYKNAEPQPNESAIKWTNWKRAKEFFERAVDFKGCDAKNGNQFAQLREAIKVSKDPDSDTISPTLLTEIIARAWECWLGGKELDAEELRIKHTVYEGEGSQRVRVDDGDFTFNAKNGTMQLTEQRTFGGIDVGKTKVTAPKSPDDEAGEETDAEEDARAKAAASKLDELKKRMASAKKGAPPVEEPKGKLDQLAERAAANSAKKANGNGAKPVIGPKTGGKQPLRGGIGAK